VRASFESGIVPAADDRLQALTPEHRTALLLMLMEGFSLVDVSAIL
jgi:DNA-directed RNA polymerase specialized sigma24 family protein